LKPFKGVERYGFDWGGVNLLVTTKSREEKMKSVKQMLCVLVGLSLIMGWVVGWVPFAQAQTPIKIGVLAPLSGFLTYSGEGLVAGTQIAKNEVNAKGGVLGRSLELIVRDTKSTPESGAMAAKKLILEDKVDFLVGVTGSSVALAVTQVSEEYKTPFVNAISVSSKLTEDNFQPYYFRTCPNSVAEGRRMALFEKDTKNMIYYTIGADYEFPHAVIEAFVEYLGKIKPQAKIVGELWAPPDEMAMTPYITKILAEKPDMVLSMIEGTSFEAFARQAKMYRFHDNIREMNATERGGSAATRSLGKDYPKNIFVNASNTDYYPGTPSHQAFNRAVREQTGHPFVTILEIQGYRNVIFLMKAVEKAGTLDADAVVKAGEGLTWEDPIAGTMAMRTYDHQADTGFIWGNMGFTADSPDSAMMLDPKYYGGIDLYHTVDEIKAIRNRVGNKYADYRQ
jgi:branched-chain amino acid transport system substrate-binding protein